MLPQTLEVEWFLRERCKAGSCSDFITGAIKDLESFVHTFVIGGFRLIPAEEPILPKEPTSQDLEAQRRRIDTLSGFQEGFAFFFGARPETITPVSRERLSRARRAEQFQHYANMRHGSFAKRASERPNIQELRKWLGRTPVTYEGGQRNLTLDRVLRTCFNTSGVTSVLKENLNAAFAKVVENEYVTIWHARLGLAAAGDAESIEPMTKLTHAIKDAPPFGAVATPGWQASYLAE